MSKTIKLRAGTTVEYSLNVDTPAWVVINKITSLGSIGKMAEFKEVTAIQDEDKQYITAMNDAPDKSLKGYILDDDDDQKAFLTAAEQKATILLRVTSKPPAGYVTGRISEMTLVLAGWEEDDGTAEDAEMWTVNAKQNAITRTPASAT